MEKRNLNVLIQTRSMRILNIIIILCFAVITVSGQNGKQISIPKYPDGDTSYFYKWISALESKLNLQTLVNSKDSIHFRFWTNGQAVDIWTDNYETFYGELTNYTETYEPYNMRTQSSKPSKIYYTKVQIDTMLARKTFELMTTVSPMPSQDSIKGWQIGQDGVTFVSEISTKSIYSFKYYWTPSAQDSTLLEAKQIQMFVDSLYSILRLTEEYDKFFGTLSPGSYTNDHFIVRTKLTPRQIRKWKRYEKRHPEK